MKEEKGNKEAVCMIIYMFTSVMVFIMLSNGNMLLFEAIKGRQLETIDKVFAMTIAFSITALIGIIISLIHVGIRNDSALSQRG